MRGAPSRRSPQQLETDGRGRRRGTPQTARGAAALAQAEAVRDGRQSATDPDSFELEELVDGVRYYGREEQVTVVDGRRSLVTYRLTKALVDGWWQRSNVLESVRYLDGVPTKSS